MTRAMVFRIVIFGSQSEKKSDEMTEKTASSKDYIERIPTLEVDNYQGITLKCVLVYIVRGPYESRDARR